MFYRVNVSSDFFLYQTQLPSIEDQIGIIQAGFLKRYKLKTTNKLPQFILLHGFGAYEIFKVILI